MTGSISASSKLGEFVRNILHDKILLFLVFLCYLFHSGLLYSLLFIYSFIYDLMLNRGDYTASVAIEYYYCLLMIEYLLNYDRDLVTKNITSKYWYFVGLVKRAHWVSLEGQ